MKMPFVFSNSLNNVSNINLKMAFSAIIYRQALHNGETIQIYVHWNNDDLINLLNSCWFYSPGEVYHSSWVSYLAVLSLHVIRLQASVATEGLFSGMSSTTEWTEPRSQEWFRLSLSISFEDIFSSILEEYLIKFSTRIHIVLSCCGV